MRKKSHIPTMQVQKLKQPLKRMQSARDEEFGHVQRMSCWRPPSGIRDLISLTDGIHCTYYPFSVLHQFLFFNIYLLASFLSLIASLFSFILSSLFKNFYVTLRPFATLITSLLSLLKKVFIVGVLSRMKLNA